MLSAAEFAHKFDGVRMNGTSWMAKCPCHADRTASLSISAGDDDRPLFTCHAGCLKEDILEAINLSWCDVLPDRTPGNGDVVNPLGQLSQIRHWKVEALSALGCEDGTYRNQPTVVFLHISGAATW